MDLKKFEETPVMGILRGVEEYMIAPLIESVFEAGLTCIEITMNTANANELIKKMVDTAGDKLIVGAGTVLTTDDFDKATEAGASFIVSPVTDPAIIKLCSDNDIPVFPGALTPTEIYKAWDLGAYMVKVFPAKVFGYSYFKEVKAPLNNVKLMATGGVSEDNVKDFFNNGADAVSFGASIFVHSEMKKGDYSNIKERISKLIANS